MSKKTERITRLIEILKKRNYVSIKELSTLLGVSEMTVRRDIRILQQEKLAENVAGTMVYTSPVDKMSDESEYTLSAEQNQQNLQKEAIGAFAASLLRPGDIVIIDTGTTTEKIIPHIPSDTNLTVLSYNMNILTELHKNPNIQILFAGGRYHPNTQMFESPEGIAFINSIRSEKVFISAAGVHEDLGLTCMHAYEVPTKQAILKSSLYKILVTDSSKFNKVRSFHFCDLSEIDMIITDDDLSKDWIDRINSHEIKLYLVPFKTPSNPTE